MLRSLRFQFGFALVAVQIVMLSIIVWNGNSNFRHNYEHRLYDTAKNLAAQVAATSARFLFELDTARLGEYVRQSMSHEELLFVAIYDVDGLLAASQGPVPAPGTYSEVTDAHGPHNDVLIVSQDVRNNGEPLGRAVLGFSLEMMEASLAEARRQSLLLAAILVGITVFLAVLLGRTLTRDLTTVSAAVADYGSGKSTFAKINAKTNEVQSVVEALKTMALGREEAEFAVVTSERRLRDIADNIEDGVWISSADFSETRYVNPAFKQLFGLAIEDLQKDPISWTNALAPEEAAKIQSTIDEIISMMAKGDDAQISRFEYPLYKVEGPDGITRDVYARSVAMKDSDGKIERFVGVATDVTQLLEAQKELRASNERLLQAQKMESIGQLTGGVAHDFNNLLAVILGNLELVDESENQTEIKGYIDAAKSATHRGADLTKSLLSFARQSSLEPAAIDINQMVKETKSWSSRVIPENIDVDISLLAGLWRAEADPSLTQNALLNLILNARDAMPLGGKMTIETSNVRIDDEYNELRGEDVEPGRYVMLAVSDTGEGISKENIAQIFDPFFTTKPVGMGSGLGLSMVQGFLKQSGGTVRVYSEEGVGTTFKLYFKAVSGKPDEPSQKEAKAPEAAEAGARVFVVEDEEAVLDVLKTTLKKAGYQITSAQSGDEALRMWNDDANFDLLVTDIVMPGDLQGTQLARTLRDRHPQLPVVFMSGYASEATVHGNGLRPEDIRLMKPVRRVDLLAAVRKALKPVR